MEWKEELNEAHDLGDKVQFKVFATAKNPIELSIDGVNFFPPNTLKSDTQGFDITIDKNNENQPNGQVFWIKEWGYLSIPNPCPTIFPPPPPLEASIGHGPWMDSQPAVLAHFKPIYQSFIQADFSGKDLVRLEFPSHTVLFNEEYKDQFAAGKRGRVRIEVRNEAGNLELIMDNDADSCLNTDQFANNHSWYLNVPKGRKSVTIFNKANSGFPILAECFRQDSTSSGAFFDFGPSKIIKPGETQIFNADFTLRGTPNELFKINCLTRFPKEIV